MFIICSIWETHSCLPELRNQKAQSIYIASSRQCSVLLTRMVELNYKFLRIKHNTKKCHTAIKLIKFLSFTFLVLLSISLQTQKNPLLFLSTALFHNFLSLYYLRSLIKDVCKTYSFFFALELWYLHWSLLLSLFFWSERWQFSPCTLNSSFEGRLATLDSREFNYSHCLQHFRTLNNLFFSSALRLLISHMT